MAVLQGREPERREVGRLVECARTGGGGVLWYVGDPGVGKSALLDTCAADAAAAGCRVLRVEGREAEADLGWSGTAALLGPLLDEGGALGLPEVQRAALLGALAMAPFDAPVEPYAVLVAARGLLRAAAADGPLLVVVDDVHWLDDPSRLLVDYIARRAEALALGVVVAGRPESGRTTPVPVASLSPLDASSCRALLRAAGVTSPAVWERLTDELGGNPLLLRAAAELLDPAQRQGTVALPDLLPVPPSASRLAEQRIAGLSTDARTCLLVVAVSPERDLGTIVRATERAGASPDALGELEGHGVVELWEGEVRFSHPTVRAAAFHASPGATRRAAHAAVAAVLAEPAARAWHRALSLRGPDEAAASELEVQAADAARRGALMAAARYHELAARVSCDPGHAVRRLRLAAEVAADAGEDAVAGALVDRAEAIGAGDPEETWRRRRLRLLVRLRSGDIDESVRGLRELAAEAADAAPRLASEILLDTLPPLVHLLRPAEVLEVATEARTHAEAAGDARLLRRAEVAQGVGRLGTGDPAGQDLLVRYDDVLRDEGAVAAGAFLAEVVGPCLAVFQRTPEVHALFDSLERDLREHAAAPALVAVLAARAIINQRQDLARAASLAGEALELARSIGRPAMSPVAAVSLACSAAYIGDRLGCREGVELLLEAGEPGLVQPALLALGLLHLAHDELDEALAVYDRLVDEVGMGVGMVRWEADWCEALVRARRRDDAMVAVEQVAASDVAWLASGGLARVRGMLAEDPAEADSSFELSVAFLGMVGNRFGEARSELCWGEHLRRARRRAAARRHVERALTLFDDVGAEIWTQRARRELEALGGTSAPGALGIEALSSRELDIARLAAAGATNQEIGDALFLSARTVETHLSAVFRKLGIRNRRQLAARAAEEPRLRR